MSSRDTLTIHENLHALTSYLVLILSLCAFKLVYPSPVADKIIKKNTHYKGFGELYHFTYHGPQKAKLGTSPDKKKVVNLQSKTCLRGRPQLRKN